MSDEKNEKKEETKEKVNETKEEVDDILIPQNKKILLQGKEESRIYEFADLLIEIIQPVLFLASKDYHKVVDFIGKVHYIPKGWRRLIITPMGVKEVDAQLTEEKEGKKRWLSSIG